MTSPTHTVERHSRRRQIELAARFADRCKIYLDLRFWIIAREAEDGTRTDAPSRELLALLRRGVAEGTLVCPLSASVFLELMKQPFMPNRRIATARLMDELGLGLTLMRPDRIMATEVHAFTLHLLGRTDLHDMDELVWTKAGYVLGDTYPVPDGFDGLAVERMQIAFFDHLWERSLSDVVAAIGAEKVPPDDNVELSRITSERCREHAHELRSYKGAYDIELRGVIAEMGPIAAELLGQAMRAAVGRPLIAEELRLNDNAGHHMLHHAMAKPEHRRRLRSMHIGAAIHAAMRWDKQRSFKPNDWYDFQHATAALGYCDAFLTEGPLHHLLTRPQLELSSVTSCRMASRIDGAVELVRSVVGKAS